MNCNIEKLRFEEARAKIYDFPYALIYELSRVVLCRVNRDTAINWNELSEARFFGPTSELHIFGSRQAVLISDCQDEHILTKEYELTGKFASVGKSFTVKQYLKPDDDGQMTVYLTRLSGIK